MVVVLLFSFAEAATVFGSVGVDFEGDDDVVVVVVVVDDEDEDDDDDKAGTTAAVLAATATGDIFPDFSSLLLLIDFSSRLEFASNSLVCLLVVRVPF